MQPRSLSESKRNSLSFFTGRGGTNKGGTRRWQLEEVAYDALISRSYFSYNVRALIVRPAMRARHAVLCMACLLLLQNLGSLRAVIATQHDNSDVAVAHQAPHEGAASAPDAHEREGSPDAEEGLAYQASQEHVHGPREFRLEGDGKAGPHGAGTGQGPGMAATQDTLHVHSQPSQHQHHAPNQPSQKPHGHGSERPKRSPTFIPSPEVGKELPS